MEQKPGESVFDVAECVAREVAAKKKTSKKPAKKPAPVQGQGESYGGVTVSQKDDAMRKLRDMLLGRGENATNGLDMKTLLEQGGIAARLFVCKGDVKFADFTREMYNEMNALGYETAENLKPYLKKMYMQLQVDDTMDEAVLEGMDQAKTVRAYDLTALGKLDDKPSSKPSPNKPAPVQEDGKPVKEEDFDVDAYLRDALNEFDSVLEEFKRAGRDGLSLSVVGMNSWQIEVLPHLIGVGARVGYAMVRKGLRSFNAWAG